jgi:hypothetical protein
MAVQQIRECPLTQRMRGSKGSFAHGRIFESGRSAAILLTSLVEICNVRCHRILIFATSSANGRLQSTPVSGQENRDRQVWVEAVWKRQICVITPC